MDYRSQAPYQSPTEKRTPEKAKTTGAISNSFDQRNQIIEATKDLNDGPCSRLRATLLGDPGWLARYLEPTLQTAHPVLNNGTKQQLLS